MTSAPTSFRGATLVSSPGGPDVSLLAHPHLAQILVVLDISVVNTAMPVIGADLGLAGGELQWMVTAYLLLSGGGLLTGLATLMYTLARTESHGWGSSWTLGGVAVAAAALAGFLLVERRVSQPLVHPHTWSINSLVWATAVMLGITGLLMGTIFLTSNFRPDQARLLRVHRRPGVPAAGGRTGPRHPPRLPRRRAPVRTSHLHGRAGCGRRRGAAALPRHLDCLLRH